MPSTKQAYLIDKDYAPSRDDIICGKGEICVSHHGNIVLRQVIEANLEKYCSITSKVEKSVVVADIIDAVQSRNCNTSQPTRFVRFNKDIHMWYDIGEGATRQKVGQAICEALLQQDPKKRAINKLKRAQNYRARRQLAMKHRPKRMRSQSLPDDDSRPSSCHATILTTTTDEEENSSSTLNYCLSIAPVARSVSEPCIHLTFEDDKLKEQLGTTPCLADFVLSSCLASSPTTCSSNSSTVLSSGWFDIDSESPLPDDYDLCTIFDDYL